jgi:hypothetical protein
LLGGTRVKVRKVRRQPRAIRPVAFFTEVPTQLIRRSMETFDYEIALPNQKQLRWKQGFDADAVAKLLSLLKRSCEPGRRWYGSLSVLSLPIYDAALTGWLLQPRPLRNRIHSVAFCSSSLTVDWIVPRSCIGIRARIACGTNA